MANPVILPPQKYLGSRPCLTVESSHLSINPDLLSPENITPSSYYEVNCQQLRECVQKLRSAPSDEKHVDIAYKEFTRLGDRAKALCEALLRPRSQRRPRSTSSPSSNPDSTGTISFETSSLSTSETRTSFSSRSSTGNGYQPSYDYEPHLDLIRSWHDCLENLLDTVQGALLSTYREWEPEASPAMVDKLFHDKNFRRNAISRMRNASIAKMMSANLDFFPKYDIRFRNYENLKVELSQIRHLSQAGESGISLDRAIQDIVISQRGDAILEFVNNSSEHHPVLRFRVSSHMLAETSPIFATMFDAGPPGVLDIEASSSLPPAASRFICKDGSEAKLFRMPQLELNVRKSFETLLHAAHMHNEMVPREIDFDSFVAIAEVCMRYRCTSPLELSVEYRWLPQWMHKATEDMPDGLLLISYAFGLRRLFTRMSKTAILNIGNEKELESKPWPQRIKDKIQTVRNAKIDQVYSCCANALQEYLRCPLPAPPAPVKDNAPNVGLVPTSKPRCPKGSHICDAAALGWLMMLFNELNILPQIMKGSAICGRPPPPRRSLNQVVDSLQFMAGPPQAHRGVCDYAPVFRAAISDIYNSVAGLTLFDVSGKHGWALSKHKSLLPQPVFKIGAPLPDPDVAKRGRKDIALRILEQLDNLEDVYNTALVNRTFFETFKTNELLLMKGLIRKVNDVSPERWTVNGAANKEEARIEMISLREEQAISKEKGSGKKLEKVQNEVTQNGTHTSGHHRAPENQSQFDEDSDSDEEGYEDAESHSAIEVDDSTLTSPAEPMDNDVKMTREEAERILWPDDDRLRLLPSHAEHIPTLKPEGDLSFAGDIRNGSEKFRAGDPAFTSLEEKNLAVTENKHLRDEHDEKLGLSRPKHEERVGSVHEWI
ncbi:hypothetical protein BJ170DRAFT_161751 [Xylariales sp. AK1849]|nr:hypothetical protein BJ170DRAFT_161751 [Xylariales sp. AK1849]